jgi:hypothetical protein
VRLLSIFFFLAVLNIGNPVSIASKVTDNKRLGHGAKSSLHSSVSTHTKELSFAGDHALDLSFDEEYLHRRASGRSLVYDVVL